MNMLEELDHSKVKLPDAVSTAVLDLSETHKLVVLRFKQGDDYTIYGVPAAAAKNVAETLLRRVAEIENAK